MTDYEKENVKEEEVKDELEEQLHSDDEQSHDDEEEERDYAEEIREVIAKYNENPLALSTFSTGSEIDAALGIPAVHVDGVGRLAYPLCKEQTVTLLGVSSQSHEVVGVMPAHHPVHNGGHVTCSLDLVDALLHSTGSQLCLEGSIRQRFSGR